MLFGSLLKPPCFTKTAIKLLFTKVDQLDYKLSTYPIKIWWPDYSGDPHSANDVIQFFTNKFMSLNQDSKRHISVHTVNLVDIPNTWVDIPNTWSYIRDEVFTLKDTPQFLVMSPRSVKLPWKIRIQVPGYERLSYRERALKRSLRIP